MNGRDETVSQHNQQMLRPFRAPDTKPGHGESALIQLNFSVQRRPQQIDFSFVLRHTALGPDASQGKKVKVPDLLPVPARRRLDGLWRSTCLEIFVADANLASYLELNLSPSGDWNVYAFDRYREGMRLVAEVDPPLQPLLSPPRSSDAQSTELQMTWRASLKGGPDVTRLLAGTGLVMNATAVLEYQSGEIEYWALAHAQDRPDFHNRQCFCLSL